MGATGFGQRIADGALFRTLKKREDMHTQARAFDIVADDEEPDEEIDITTIGHGR